MAEATQTDEADDDRQPDFLRWPDSEPEVPEIDGNRAAPGSASAPSGAPARTGPGRRRRRRRWRGGPRQPAQGSHPGGSGRGARRSVAASPPRTHARVVRRGSVPPVEHDDVLAHARVVVGKGESGAR